MKVSHNNGEYKINIDGQDCDNVSLEILEQVQNFIYDDEGIWLNIDDLFEKVDKIYLNEGVVEEYTYAL